MIKTILILIIINASFLAQPLTWQKAYNSFLGNDEEGYTVCKADGSNFFVSGMASDPRIGFIIKLNQYGDTLWKKLLPQFDFIYSSAGLPDGGCVLTGNQGGVVRLNSQGNLIWAKVFTHTTFEHIELTSDNSLLLCGVYDSALTRTSVICKLNQNGGLVWYKLYSGYEDALFKILKPATDGGYLIAGAKGIVPNRSMLIKTDTSGSVLWSRYYYTGSITGISTIEYMTNGYILSGYTDVVYTNNQAFIMKTTLNGDSLRTISYPCYQFSTYFSMLKANNNRYFHVSAIPYLGNSGAAPVIRILDSNFAIKKEIIITPILDYLEINDMVFLPNSNSTRIAFTGITSIFSPNNEDLYAAVIDSSITPPPPIGIVNISGAIPDNFSLQQNYPNPFNPVTKINFDLPERSAVNLKVYDLLGRTVAELVSEELTAGSYEVDFDGSNLASGLYFYTLATQNFTATKKMILLK